MTLPFVDRAVTPDELVLLRLVLSTYQDGSGMLATSSGRTLPGWRDFERSVAITFNGKASESKAIFDVLIPDPNNPAIQYGLSCKMRKELNRVDREGKVTIELSNSAGKFWDKLATLGIDVSNYKDHPTEVGTALIDLIEQWHITGSIHQNSRVDLSKSFYLVLSWNNRGDYQLHQFPLALPNPKTLQWYFPTRLRGKVSNVARHLNGDDSTGRVFEWYGESGGQLKYYPHISAALWQSEKFRLEDLPDIQHGVLAKVEAYFPKLWANIAVEARLLR